MENHLAGSINSGLRFAANLYLKDLRATPEEVLCACPGGAARTPLAFTAELVGYHQLVALILGRGPESLLTEEERVACASNLTCRDQAIEEFGASVETLAEAVSKVEASDWETQVTAPWGMPITKAELAGFSSLHLMYHDGQLNYLQTMHGDTDVHWI